MILSIKAFNDDGTASLANVYAAVKYAIEAKVDIINNSASVPDSANTVALRNMISELIMIYSMDMNIKKTKQYYRRLTDEDICDCSYCRNYVREIRATYGDVAAYLDKIGIEIEKPFEVIPIGPDNETMFYSGAQYVVIGAADDFMETSIGTVRIVETDSHPVTDIQEEHFVIELSPIYLRWNHEE